MKCERPPEWFHPVLIDHISGIMTLPITSFHNNLRGVFTISVSRKLQNPCYTASWIIQDIQQPYIQNYTGRRLISC